SGGCRIHGHGGGYSPPISYRWRRQRAGGGPPPCERGPPRGATGGRPATGGRGPPTQEGRCGVFPRVCPRGGRPLLPFLAGRWWADRFLHVRTGHCRIRVYTGFFRCAHRSVRAWGARSDERAGEEGRSAFFRKGRVRRVSFRRGAIE